MADKTPEQEPSIEEILASIRQIISDDDDEKDGPVEAAPAPAPKPPEPTPPPAPEPTPPLVEDVLELTDPISEPEPEVEFEPEPAQDDSILSDSTRQAAIASMAKLAGNMPITRHREYGAVTLEDLVREMLNPMLREWMDHNLPRMVERMVQKELEKLARRAMDE